MAARQRQHRQEYEAMLRKMRGGGGGAAGRSSASAALSDSDSESETPAAAPSAPPAAAQRAVEDWAESTHTEAALRRRAASAAAAASSDSEEIDSDSARWASEAGGTRMLHRRPPTVRRTSAQAAAPAAQPTSDSAEHGGLDVEGLELGDDEPTPPAVTPRGELSELRKRARRVYNSPAKATARSPPEPSTVTTANTGAEAEPALASARQRQAARRRARDLDGSSDDDGSDGAWLAGRKSRAASEQARKLSSAPVAAAHVAEDDEVRSPELQVEDLKSPEEAAEDGQQRAGRTTTAEVQKVRAEVNVNVPAGASAQEAVDAARQARVLLATAAGTAPSGQPQRREVGQPPAAGEAADALPQPYGSKPRSAEKRRRFSVLSDSDSDSDAETEEEALPTSAVRAAAEQQRRPVTSSLGHARAVGASRLFVPDVNLDGSLGFQTGEPRGAPAAAQPQVIGVTTSGGSSYYASDTEESDQLDDSSLYTGADESTNYQQHSTRHAVPDVDSLAGTPSVVHFNHRAAGGTRAEKVDRNGPARSVSWPADDKIAQVRTHTKQQQQEGTTQQEPRGQQSPSHTAEARADAVMAEAWRQAEESLHFSSVSVSQLGRLPTIISAGSQSGSDYTASTASTSGYSSASATSMLAGAAPPPPTPESTGRPVDEVGVQMLAPLAASSSHPRAGEILSPILPDPTPMTPAPGTGPRLASALSRPATEEDDVSEESVHIGSLLPASYKPPPSSAHLRRPDAVCGPAPSSPQHSRQPEPEAEQRPYVVQSASTPAWTSRSVPAVPSSPLSVPVAAPALEQPVASSAPAGNYGSNRPTATAPMVPPSPPAAFTISMSEYRRGGLDPASERVAAPEAVDQKDLVSRVGVRPRNVDVRSQLESSEFGLLDLRLAQQRGEAEVLLQQQQLLEDQVEQIALQRQQARRLGLAAVANALQPAETSVRQAAAEVLNRQHQQQEQAAAQAALVEDAGRWRCQVSAVHQAETWAADQERGRAAATLDARCAAVAAEIREASRLGLAPAEELAVAWSTLDDASQVAAPGGGSDVSSLVEQAERVDTLARLWSEKLVHGAAATVALAAQRQQRLHEQFQIQAEAELLMAEDERRQADDQWRRTLLSPRRRSVAKPPHHHQHHHHHHQPQHQHQHQPQKPEEPEGWWQPLRQPERKPLQVQTEAQAQISPRVQEYQQRFQQYKEDKYQQQHKAAEAAPAAKQKAAPPGGRHTARRALLRRRRAPGAAAPTTMELRVKETETAEMRIHGQEEQIRQLQADALLRSTPGLPPSDSAANDQENAFSQQHAATAAAAGGGGGDSPGTREVHKLLLASREMRRSVEL